MRSFSHSRTSLDSSAPPSSPESSAGRPRSPFSDAATSGRSSRYSRPHSTSSISGRVLSASELASSDTFDEWRRGTLLTTPLSVGGAARWDGFPVPPVVRSLGNYLLDVRLPEWIFENSSRIAPLPGVRHVDMFVEEDAALKSSYERIEEESTELARLHNQQVKGETNWRTPVDILVRKAFVKPRALPKIPSPAECHFICDLALDMPYSSTPLNVEKTALADTVISTSLYPSPSMFSLDSQVFEELRVDKERHDSLVICIPHLVVKHKYGSNQTALTEATHELHFCIGAGMHQRRLLGFEREPMFGVACNDGKARAFTAYWKDNQIQIVRLYAEDFDLQVLEQACLFFLLLLRIRHQITLFASELERVDGAGVEERMKVTERSWKADPTYPAPPGTSWPTSRSNASSPAARRSPSPIWSVSRDGSSSSDTSDKSMDVDDSTRSLSSHYSQL